MDLSEFWTQNQTWLSQCAAIITTGFGCFQWFQRRREARHLAEIENRGNAPFLSPYSSRFAHLYVKDPDGPETYMCDAHAPNVLSYAREEVAADVDREQWIIFPIENRGEGARWLQVKPRDPELKMRFTQSEHLSGSPSVPLLIYEFNPEMRGKTQQFILLMESDTGVQRTHEYSMIHGKRALWRSDPPMPAL